MAAGTHEHSSEQTIHFPQNNFKYILKGLKIIQNVFFNPNGNKSGKALHIWKLNNILMKNSWIKEDIIRKIRKYFELN